MSSFLTNEAKYSSSDARSGRTRIRDDGTLQRPVMWMPENPTKRLRIANCAKKSALSARLKKSASCHVRPPPVGSSLRFTAADTKALSVSRRWKSKLAPSFPLSKFAHGFNEARKILARSSRCARGSWRIWYEAVSFQLLRKLAQRILEPSARWCNGNTEAFGAFIHGSNPCRAASSFFTYVLP